MILQEGQGFYPPVYGAPQAQAPQQELEVTYLYIPENTVGAVIGSKGANIKQVMKDSSARIKVRKQHRADTETLFAKD